MRSDPVLKKWYNTLNKKFFDNYLPTDTCVRWSNEDDVDDDERCEEKYNGWAFLSDKPKTQFVIVISSTLRKSMCTRLHTLAHEMCHVATGCKDNHGPSFEHWRQTIADRGIFKKGAVVKNYTLF